jgi:hypothetical protein
VVIPSGVASDSSASYGREKEKKMITKLNQIIEGQVSQDEVRTILCDALKEKDALQLRYFGIMEQISKVEDFLVYGTDGRPSNQTYR